MCGRFTLRTSSSQLLKEFQLAFDPDWNPRFNIAPTQEVLAVRRDASGGRVPAKLRWGLIPSWAKDAKIGNQLINARAETVREKPSFRSAFKQRRCLVLADGYYEWQRVNAGSKQPFHIRMRDGRAFALAGLWEHWKGPDGPIESCTLITTDANDLTRPIHDRMPVIVPAHRYDLWLDPEFQGYDSLEQLLSPFPPEEMEAVAVSKVVNNPRNEGERCVAPAEQD